MTQSVDECPDCGAKMIERTNRKTGEVFLGCSQYPDCTGTRELRSGIEGDDLPSNKMRGRDRRRWES